MAKFTSTIECTCSRDGKGLGIRNDSGHKENCPEHKRIMKERRESERARKNLPTRSAR
jgi:hypothetical protein